MSYESVAFENCLQKTNRILRFIGLQTDDKESDGSTLKRIWNRKLYLFCNSVLYFELMGEIAWMIRSILNGDFVQATYCAPCATLCFLGTVKTYYRIKYSHHLNDLINSLRGLMSTQSTSSVETNSTALGEIRDMVRTIHLSFNILIVVNVIAVIAFFTGPLAIMAFIYFTSGEVVLRLPFLILYPFNPFDLRVYPFIYLRHVFGGTFVLVTVFGPDCLYYTFCTFIQVQFRLLYHDFQTIVTLRTRNQLRKYEYDEKLRACIRRHREIIRCCDVIEAVYTKSSLFNFMASSLLLCLSGFNIMAYEDLAMLSNFLSFLFICLLQIYLMCDYGDKVSRASMDLSAAVYNSQWYNIDAKAAKNLLIILTRAQKPCKLTACKFAEINLGAFTRILSSSWSYFALLKSMYSRNSTLESTGKQ